MNIIGFKIKNFKSISEINIPLNEYGLNHNKSKVSILVGLNETGKSTILKAISYLSFDDSYKEINYADDCNKAAFDNDEQIEISATIEINQEYLLAKKNIYDLPINLINSLVIVEPELYVIANKNETIQSLYFDFNGVEYFKYAYDKSTKLINSKNIEIIKIIDISENNKNTNIFNLEEAEELLTENQIILTKELLDEYLTKKFNTWIKIHLNKIQLWKSTSKYLINETISLEKFKENPEISIPLKNIFHIAGINDKDSIKSSIEKVFGNQGKIEELKFKLANAINKHINKVWKEHKIKLHISINGGDCEVHVEDKDKSFKYYQMNQRSDGFKQFVSLILTLSALNESQKLSNNIILIDEPEVHLHPSGIRDMRNEILKIGKNNFIFVSTHSHYMVDNSCSERHWIVTKEKSETKIEQVNEITPIEDDKVLASAFGINVFKELLPENIIIVEGGDDKIFINHCIRQLKSKIFYSIKSAGGASKIPGLTTLLSDENISAFVVFDDDKEGRDNRKIILEKKSPSFSEQNVFTLRDLNPSLNQFSTIEDLMPLDFVNSFFEKEMETKLSLESSSPVIHQLKNQFQTLKDNKQKLDSLKIKLTNAFCKTYDTKNKIENSCENTTIFIENLTRNINSFQA